MVQKVLAVVPNNLKKGPVIVTSAKTPFRSLTYGTLWRSIADKAGIPKEIMNRDSRAGAATEATDANVPLESARQALQHSNTQTTARYSRNAGEKTAEVAKARVAARSKNKP